MSDNESRLYEASLIRFVEERLLDLFAAGKVSGTTHTCIGQELSAVVLAESLDRSRDIVFSNHRCHGHYLAWTDDVDGLVAEIMGKPGGVCGGIGGSQHLCANGFFSNGIQGGIVPVAAGLAFVQKRKNLGGIIAVCIGDGTLGEGIVYETLNIASKWRLPLLFMLENNGYAQSTSQNETLAGDICARAEAFGIETLHADTWDADALAATMQRAARIVRGEGRPAFVRVDTYRLAAHSKGDDDRDPVEIADYRGRDPVDRFLARVERSHAERLEELRARVARAVDRASREPPPSFTEPVRPARTARTLAGAAKSASTQLDAINAALRNWLADDPELVLIGEDIRSPYGGAFKVTRGLSDAFPERVLNTPISEAAIVGIGNGIGLGGARAVVEIMFGDFLGLAFDQIVNHAAKFHGMYNRKARNPLVLRTPMGGGRGYGPTHSQNLEKHVAGIPGLTVLVMHRRTRVAELYAELRGRHEPVLIIENKLLYRESAAAAPPRGYTVSEHGDGFPTTLVRPERADVTLVAFGRMSVAAERAAERLADEEIYADLVYPLEVWPLDAEPILESVARTGKLLVVEEGASGFDLGAEVIACAAIAHRGARRLHVRRVGARPVPIPSAVTLERAVIPGEDDIVAACLELFDE